MDNKNCDTEETINTKTNITINPKKPIILLNDWELLIKARKIRLIKYYNSSNYLDNSYDNKIFINIIQSTLQLNIFDITRISYFSILLLDNIINPNILLNVVNIKHYEPLTENERNIMAILDIIVNLVVHIEMSLNIHTLLIINFLNNTYKSNVRPSIFTKLDKISYDLHNNIKPSNTILLLFKLIKTIGTFNYNKLYENILKDNVNASISNVKILNNHLDNFMCKINNYFETDHKNTNYQKLDINFICIDYIKNLTNVLFDQFDDIYNIFIKYVMKDTVTDTNTDTENINKCNTQRKIIKNFLEIEKDNIINKFYDIK
jgi:hypothetical protein